MVKIIIQLEDIIKGEKFKSEVVSALKDKGLPLSEKHVNLYSEDMPTIGGLCKKKYQIKLTIKSKNKVYEIQVPKIESGVLRAGLCWMYGYGLVKYDYELPVFQGLEKDILERYQRFAVQIWERNIHRDWMQGNKKYEHHNGDFSKGPKFLYGVSSEDENERWSAVEEHRRITDAQEGGETPHHIFRDSDLLKLALLDQGKNKDRQALLIESIYDQATATTRTWYPDRKKKSFEERLSENVKKGYFCDDFRWTPGSFNDFRIDYEDKIWKIWCKAHKEFRDYWIAKFGKNEEFWQPPVPLEKLD